MSKQPGRLPTLQQIREAHGWKYEYEKYMPISRFFYRPIGFFVTWGAVRIGMTTEMVSFLSGIVGTIACLLLIGKNEVYLIIGIFLLHLFNLLDCVDGSIARVMKTENTYGKFLDSVMGDLVDFAFFFTISIMVFRHPDLVTWSNPFKQGAIFWLVIGCLCAFLYIFLRHIEVLYEFQIYNKQVGLLNTPPPKPQNENRLNSKPHIIKTKEVDLKNMLRLLGKYAW